MIVTSNFIAPPESAEQRKTGNSALGKEEFLKLLIEQIKSQDPLNPMDNTEFTAQMAQFSSLEQLFNVNDNLEGLMAYQASMNNSSVLNMIGREVTTEGSVTFVKEGQASEIHYDLSGDAAVVTIQIFDKDGDLVKTIRRTELVEGSQTASWNAKNDLGGDLEDGAYEYSVVALDTTGNLVETSTYSTGIVEGVTFENGVTYLRIGGMKVMLSEVREVMAVEEAPRQTQPASLLDDILSGLRE